MIRSMYRPAEGELQTDLALEAIDAARQDAEGLLRIDLCDEPAAACEPILRDLFGFHPLAVDDALAESHYWSAYDRAILRSSAPPELQEQLAPRFVDLLAVCRRAVSLPVPSLSLKAVSRYLGFPWPGHDDWLAAYLDYRTWLDRDDVEMLARACAYQRADVQALAWV